MDALLTEVVTSTQGSHATAAVAIGGTTVPVENLTPFASDGGRVDIAGVVYDYTGVDDTTVDADGSGGSLLLDSTLSVAVAEFDPVLAMAGDAPAVDYYAIADLVDNEDGEPVWVPLLTREERLAWPTRAYDPPLPVTLAPDLSRITSAPGVPPQMDGAFLAPDSVTADAIDLDTLPPPAPLQTVSTDPAPTDVTGYDEGHVWWQVDADDKVLATSRLVAGVFAPIEIVTIDALKANNILVTALNGEQITGATVQTRPEVERGIKLLSGEDEDGNPLDAFYVFDEAGVPFITAVPATGMAVIAGEMKSASLTVSPLQADDKTSLAGVVELVRHPDGSAGALRLTGYTTRPASAPIATSGYDTVQFTADGLWGNRVGWATDGTYWYTARIVGLYHRVEKWSAAGALVATGSQTDGAPYGVAVGGSYVHVLWSYPDGYTAVNRYVATTLAYDSAAQLVPANIDGARDLALGWDSAASELLIAQSRASDDKVRVKRFTMSGSTLTASATAAVDTTTTWTANLRSVLYGSFDFGANRYVLGKVGTGDVRTITTAGAFQTGEYFPPGGDLVGVAHNGTSFVTMDTTGLMRTHTGIVGTTADLTKWVSNTLANATLETDQSPRAKIVMPRRSKLNVTTSAINTGGTNAPDRVKIYVGQGSTDPTNTNMIKQADPSVGVVTKSYTTIATSPDTNPPTTNGFAAAAGTVQRVELTDGTVFIDGNGDGDAWKTYTPTFSASVTPPTLGNFTVTGRWTRVGKLVHFVAIFTCNTAAGMGSGNYQFGLPVAARATNEIVCIAQQSAPNHGYQGRGASTTSVNLYLTSTDAIATVTSTGMAAGTSIRVTGTYEAA